MRSTVLVMAVLLAASAAAQEAEEPEAAVDTRPHLQVLSDPYALASFYRSDGAPPLVSPRDNPYAIAGYYRSRQAPPAWAFAPVPYPIYWTQRPRPRRHIGGPSASLYWLAPTFLAPVVPLTDPLPDR